MSEICYLGVDLGRTTRIAVVDAEGRIQYQTRVATDLTGGRELVGHLLEEIILLKKDSGYRIAAVGVGLPGLIESSTQQVKILPNLPDVSSINVHAEMVSAIGLPVIFDNDANAATYGEWRCGAAKHSNNAIYISVGTGIGGGIIMGGTLQRGAMGYAGEFGHVKVGIESMECSCGSAGCLETVASGPNIVRRAREMVFNSPLFMNSPLAAKMSGRLTCEDIIEAASHGDELAIRVMNDTADYLGTAIANVINLFNIDLIVLGGPVMAAADLLLGRIREYSSKRCFPQLYECCKIVAAELGDDAGVIGSAMMARDKLSEMEQRAAAKI